MFYQVEIEGRVVMLSAGDSHTVALTEDGRVFAWGTFRWVSTPWPSQRTRGSLPRAPSGESQHCDPHRGREGLRLGHHKGESQHCGPHRGREGLRLGHLQVSHNTVALTEDGRVFAWGTFRLVPQAKPTVFRISGYFIYIKIRLEKNTYLPSPLNHVLFSIIYIYRYIVAFSRRIPFLTSVWKPYLQILVGCPAFL